MGSSFHLMCLHVLSLFLKSTASGHLMCLHHLSLLLNSTAGEWHSLHPTAGETFHPTTSEALPNYFQVEGMRAAAWRERCKKVYILFQHLQLDLKFASPDLARSFLGMLDR